MSYEDDLLTISEAARRSGKSVMTIRKYLGLTGQPSRLPNARKHTRPGENQETWAIPLSDLFNAGLMKGKVAADPKPEEEVSLVAQPVIVELIELRAENAAQKKQIELLEANLADLRLMLGRSIETAETQTARRKFWQR